METEMITIPKSIYESERKMRFFGATPKEIYKKKFNIFLGISISNKKITKNMAYNYLKWALKNTKNKVAIIIADELDIVNREVFDKYSKGKAKNRTMKDGDKFEKLFKKVINKFSKKEQDKIKIYRWSKVKTSKNYLKIKKFLEEQYKKDFEFKSAVLYFVKKYVRKKGKTKILENEKKLDKLATYILGELPTFLQGIYLDNYYNLCIYPTYFASGMSQFVTDIWEDELNISQELKKKIKNKAVLIESWLD